MPDFLNADALGTLITNLSNATVGAQTAAADALASAGIDPAYVSDSTADPLAAPNGTRGAKRLPDGGIQRLTRVAGAWVPAGTALLARGSNGEAFTSWAANFTAALNSGHEIIHVDSPVTATTTTVVPTGVALLQRDGGLIEFPSGTPDLTGVALSLSNEGATLGDGLIIRVTGGSFTRGVQPRADNLTIGDIDLQMSNPIAATNVNSFGLLLSHLTPIRNLRVGNARVKMTNHARPMPFSIGRLIDARLGILTAYDTVATSPNKLDWGCYIAQECDGLIIDGIVVLNSNTGGVHFNDGDTNPKGKRKHVGFISVNGVLFNGVALENYESLSTGPIHVDGAGCLMVLGRYQGGDSGTGLGPIYLANVVTPIGADAEMLQMNSENSQVAVTFGPKGNALRAALITGAGSTVRAKFKGDRPVVAAELRPTAVGSVFDAEVPDLPVASQGTTDSAIILSAPNSVLLGDVTHTTTSTTVATVRVNATATGAHVRPRRLKGTGRPWWILTGAANVRVDGPLYEGYANAPLDSGTGTFRRDPQVQADLVPAGGRTRVWKNVTTTYQVLGTDDAVRAITNSGSFTVTLPDVTAVTSGREYTVKNVGTNVCTVQGFQSGQNTDGAFSLVLGSMASATFMARSGGWDLMTPRPSFIVSATLDFPSIPANSSTELTISAPGAAVNDRVELGRPASQTAGLVTTGRVTAADTVSVRASNVTTSAIDPAAGVYAAEVRK